MGTKLERIAEISATTPKPEFTFLYHLINAEMLMQCHKELDGKKAVGIDRVTKAEYEEHLEENITNLVEQSKNNTIISHAVFDAVQEYRKQICEESRVVPKRPYTPNTFKTAADPQLV